ncbi:Radical SAM domain protein [Desulfarculus baarsii DSM 2075]|uniref:Radical SAM domain protein n=1 Tax=Desulfarculus baarsii (strain ATCC 33931 / DSM 2075 / LMG 7858 / VKM B-1802 / 2st14) TaxID=644282 RepID=E1QF15_DESB2|nr:heme b synthase [Desulfarculus baarsii]ADK84151.1 Radical SAM domain protein [Desulfarculus baarsii DSM 2075]
MHQHPHGAHPGGHPAGLAKNEGGVPPLRLLAWETTRRCNLRCLHCRAGAEDECYPDELTTAQGEELLRDLATMGRPVVILTGGEPLLRHDIFHLAAYGHGLGLRMVMGTNGVLITPEVARRLVEAGIQRISVSIDGPDAQSHDVFRGQQGAFEGSMAGIAAARAAGLEFQVNTTVTRGNLPWMQAIQDLAQRLGAVAHHIFLLVPTGRGRALSGEIISAEEYEDVLNWFYDQRGKACMELKATCAPHYFRVLRQRAKADGLDLTFQSHGLDAVSKGCLGGQGFAFVSHVGQVQACGYLDLPAGDVKKQPFSRIWQESELFGKLRDPNLLGGKCGRCEYRRVCGGCRARAFEATGDVLAEEPLCVHQPALR